MGSPAGTVSLPLTGQRMRMMRLVWMLCITFGLTSGIEPNFEDLDLVVDQAVDEKVDIDQADPHSNNIHVAHNNPKNSDIKISQSNPFNTTIHISLNVGTGAKSMVKLTNARNVQIHVSQSVPMSSPLTWKLTGDIESNQFEVRQNA